MCGRRMFAYRKELSRPLCSVTAVFTPVALLSLRLSSLLDLSSPPLPACSPIQNPAAPVSNPAPGSGPGIELVE